MTEKCSKYDSLIKFSSEAELLEHIEQCEDCKKEHENMLAVSALIQEAKPYFLKQKHRNRQLKIACALALTLFLGTSFGILDYNYNILDTLSYSDGITLEDMGLPTDDYGFIMAD